MHTHFQSRMASCDRGEESVLSTTMETQLKDPDHHTIKLDPVQFSCDEDLSTSVPSESSNSTPHLPATTGSTDGDKLLNVNGYLSPGSAASTASAGATLAPTSRSISVTSIEGDPPDVEEDRDFYETEDLGDTQKSLILQILSQLKIGMDLTKFALPVTILEKRSLLEMYAEFFAHPDILTRAADLSDPKDRMIEVVRWYLSSISASKKGAAPKKPYNPVLGEVFRCYWDIPGGKRTAPNADEHRLLETGPVESAGYDSLSLLAEQVSHHPPVSAFYAECPSKRFYVKGTVGTKTKFLGFSVKAQNNGTVHIRFLNHNEEYIGQIPNGYVRSILTYPWFEFGGECPISCKQSGYSANIEFHTKPFRGGKKHKVTAEIRHKKDKPFMKIEGEWDGILTVKDRSGSQQMFVDANAPTIRKKIKKLSKQEPYESRVVWGDLTEAIARGDSEAAGQAKHTVEERQRAEARERQHSGTEWKQRFFEPDEDHNNLSWHYKSTLDTRIKK